MDFQNIRYELKGPVAIITIAREKALNALNRLTMEELDTALWNASGQAEVHAVVITGAGDKAFVAGADISEMSELGPQEALEFTRAGHAIGETLERLPKPVIAAVNGYALGGGCELALACDFIYASERAKFGQPEVNLGVMCGFGGTQRLPRRVGISRAMEMILTGEPIGAEEALRIGLINKICKQEALMPEALKCGELIAQKGPLAIASSRQAVRRSQELSLSAANELERELFARLFASYDQKEGMRAFVQKRPPKFEGR